MIETCSPMPRWSGRTRSRTLRRIVARATLVCAVAALGAPVQATTLDPKLFPLPETLAPNVDFWRTIYAEHPSTQVLLHDERYLDIVYERIDLSDLEGLSDHRKRLLRRQRVREAEARARSILSSLAAGSLHDTLGAEQARIESLFTRVPGDSKKYRDAIHRLRTQTCLQNRFAEGIERSGQVLPEIERIFERRGLPKALTRLPFVESLFQMRARSSAAAAGIWQFVPSTARRYLRMDLERDERYDPLLAAEAAAKHLANNHRRLGTWPLALTAYNHGAAGMARAVRKTGTKDLGVIAERYRSRTFGFASRNFYSEFLAATQVYDRRDVYFPETSPLPAWDFTEIELPRYTDPIALAAQADLPLESIEKLNPSLNREIWRGDLFLPKGHALRVPAGRGDAVLAAYEALAPDATSDHQQGLRYRVRPGDTLGRIAVKFGSTIGALQRANNLRSPNLIRVGQSLLIPPKRSRASRVATRRSPAPATTPAPTTPEKETTVETASAASAVRPEAAPSSAPTRAAASKDAPTRHVVASGETLWSIAQRYDTEVDAIRARNGLRSNKIVVGQRLEVPVGSRTHVVRRGETLATIARRYGTSVSALRASNRLRGDLIRPRQVLLIP